MTDVERALERLIHDVRTPVGVAQGYVRLLQEHRLDADDGRERALARTMEALGRISRLCEDASGFIGREAAEAPVVIAATALAAAVEARVRRRRFATRRAAIDVQARIRVTGDAERLADAVSVVLATNATPTDDRDPILDMETGESELRFVVARGDLPPGCIHVASSQPLDPWRKGDLAVPLACRTIERSGGRVVIAESAVIVAVPLEVSGS